MNKLYSAICIGSVAMQLLLPVMAQSGGTFVMTKSVIAGGGGQTAGGTFTLNGTIGQPSAGTTSTGGTFNLEGGFWANPALAPTAATVVVSGRVISANGRGIVNAIISLTDAYGNARHVRTGTFGYYRFNDVVAGESYILSVQAKRFQFADPTRVINVTDNLTDENFTASP